MTVDWLKRLCLPWLWQAFPAMSLASVISCGDAALGQDSLPYWGESFREAAQIADQPPRPAVRFVWTEDELESPVEDRRRIEQAAYQTQYPLSKDSADLLPPDESPEDWSEVPDYDGIVELDCGDGSPWLVWKKTTGTMTWVAPNSGGLGITSLDARGSIEFPSCQAIWFVPRLAVNWLDGPVMSDLPGQLFDLSVETVAALPIGERWILQGAIAPSFFTDGDNVSRQGFRLPGRVLAFWKYSESLTFIGGVLYLDRDDVKAIPSAGVLWNPSDNWKFELAAPRPRIAWRFSHDEATARWFYVVGEFGGGSWAIRRASGVGDVATLSDYRLMVGYEQKWLNGRNWVVEAGYVFSRRLEYTSEVGDADLSSSALLRLGFAY